MSRKESPLLSAYNKHDNTVSIGIMSQDSQKKSEAWTEQYKMHNHQNVYSDDLSNAVRNNDEESCRQLLQNCDPNLMSDSSSMYPIQIAADNGHAGIIKLLIDAGARLDVNNGQMQSSPLHLAVEKAYSHCVTLLVSMGASIYAKDKLKNTVLHIAASKGNTALCDVILLSIKDPDYVNKCNSSGGSALHLAAFEGHIDTVTYLIEHGANITLKNNKSFTPLHLAAVKGHEKCCEVIINAATERGINLSESSNKNRPTPLTLAAKNGHYHSCRLLIELFDVNHADNSGNTALHYATMQRYLHTIQFLLSNGADQLMKNKEQNSSVHIAAGQVSDACLHTLIGSIQRSPLFNNKQQSVLHLAAQLEQTENIKLLAEHYIFKEEINHQDDKGNSPLHDVIIKGNLYAFEILYEHGATLTLTDKKNNLPLHLAVVNGRLEMVKLLLKGGLIRNINNQNDEGLTPLMLSALVNSTECCYYLLSRGAKMNIKDNYGNTALIIATTEGNVNIVQMLVKKGANPYLTLLDTGNTPLHIAASKGHKRCCEILVKSLHRLLTKENSQQKTPLDVAFLNGQDQVFSFLLSKEEEFNKSLISQKEYRFKIHEMMHVAIDVNRSEIQSSIIDGCMWFDGLDVSLCSYEFCTNFRNIVRKEPSLAEKVLDKCIVSEFDKTTFNFRLFEDTYSIKSDKASLPVQRSEIKEIPFDQTGVLLKDAQEIKGHNWARDHPLCIAIQSRRLNILHHKLTNEYLNYYWSSYVRYIFFLMIFYEVLSISLLVASLKHCENWYRISERTNLSNADCFAGEHVLSTISAEGGSISSIILMIIIIGHVIFELNCLFKIPKLYLRPSAFLRVFRIIGLSLFCIPVQRCPSIELTFGVKEDWQWQIAILTLLVSWFLMISLLNDLPILSVFMPITTTFATSFMRVLFYIIMIVAVFSLIFQLLLIDQDPFVNIYYSFIKTTVWLLGDLAYDDTFIEGVVPYPILSNVIFIFYVTSISGFIINLIINQPQDHLDDVRKVAWLMKAVDRIELLLDIGASFRTLRRRSCVAFLINYQVSVANLLTVLPGDIPVQQEKPEFSLEKCLAQMTETLVAQSGQISELKYQLEQVQLQLTTVTDSCNRLNSKIKSDSPTSS